MSVEVTVPCRTRGCCVVFLLGMLHTKDEMQWVVAYISEEKYRASDSDSSLLGDAWLPCFVVSWDLVYQGRNALVFSL